MEVIIIYHVFIFCICRMRKFGFAAMMTLPMALIGMEMEMQDGDFDSKYCQLAMFALVFWSQWWWCWFFHSDYDLATRQDHSVLLIAMMTIAIMMMLAVIDFLGTLNFEDLLMYKRWYEIDIANNGDEDGVGDNIWIRNGFLYLNSARLLCLHKGTCPTFLKAWMMRKNTSIWHKRY